MNVGKLAYTALQRLLNVGMAETELQAERRQVQAEATLCSDVSGVSRQQTEEVSLSKISGVEASVLHRTPERVSRMYMSYLWTSASSQKAGV